MGLEDRDWYWQRRARRGNPDDDHLFPGHRWPSEKNALAVVAAVLVVLALLAFGLHRGWFDRGWRPDSAKAKAEIAALRAWDLQANPDGQPAAVPRQRSERHVPYGAESEPWGKYANCKYTGICRSLPATEGALAALMARVVPVGLSEPEAERRLEEFGFATFLLNGGGGLYAMTSAPTWNHVWHRSYRVTLGVADGRIVRIAETHIDTYIPH